MIRSMRKLKSNTTLFRILIALGALSAFAMSAGAPHVNGTGFN